METISYCFKQFFKYLLKNDYVEHNPIENIERIRKNDRVTHDFLQKKDLYEILKAVEHGAGNKLNDPPKIVYRSTTNAFKSTNAINYTNDGKSKTIHGYFKQTYKQKSRRLIFCSFIIYKHFVKLSYYYSEFLILLCFF